MAIDTSPSPPFIERIIIALLLLGLPVLSIWSLQPPAPLPADAPPEVFSAERAMRHVEAIAQAPHPTGSAENQRVRDYLFSVMQDLGLNPRIESREFHWQGRDWTLHNLVGSLEGTGELPPNIPSGGAVLLMAHYDSVSAGPGAADDAAGVAAILEAIRAIRAGPGTLHNDVIVLFTDGEEQNLLGARATAEQADWLNDVSVVLNFEARGTSGPSIMFEAAANWWLIKQLAESPHPVATSLAADIYKRMPNDTDFTVIAGYHDDHYIAGLNFGFIDGASRYHTAADTPQNLSLASLQHHGEYALHLTRRLGEISSLSSHIRPGREPLHPIYFPAPGIGLVLYPDLLMMLLLTLAFGLVNIATEMTRRRRLLGLGRTLGSMLMVVASMSIAAAITWGLLKVLPYHRPQPHGHLPDEWQSRLYLLGLVAIAFAVHFGVLATLARRWGVGNVMVAAMFLSIIAGTATMPNLTGASYLFTWPAMAAAIAMSLHLITQRPGARALAVRLLGSVVTLSVTMLLYVPVVYLLTVALSIRAGFIAAAMAAFALAMLSLPLQQLAPRRPWIVALGAGGVAAVLLAIGAVIG